MDALTTSLLVAVAVFLSSLVGLSLHRVVPERHLSQETRSVILLGTGTLSLLASLVLGLPVSTAKICYGAGGEEMAPSSLCEPMECPDAPAERFEQVPRRPGPR
jgi:hypothetical protein